MPLSKELLAIVREYCEQITKATAPHECHTTTVLCDWIQPNVVQPRPLFKDFMRHQIAIKSSQLMRASEYQLQHGVIQETRQLFQPREGSSLNSLSIDAANIHHTSSASRIVFTKSVLQAHRSWLAPRPPFANYSYARLPFQAPLVTGLFVEFTHLQLCLPNAHRSSVQDLLQGQGPEGNALLLSDSDSAFSPRTIERQCLEHDFLLATQLITSPCWSVACSNFAVSSRESSQSIASAFLGLPLHKSLLGFAFPMCVRIQFGRSFSINNSAPQATIILHNST